MSDHLSASACLGWLYQTVGPEENPLDFIDGLAQHLHEQGLALPGTITTTQLGDPQAFIAELEMHAKVFSNLKLNEWVDWHDANPQGNFTTELLLLIRSGNLPWCLHQYKNDPGALRQAIRTLPPGR